MNKRSEVCFVRSRRLQTPPRTAAESQILPVAQGVAPLSPETHPPYVGFLFRCYSDPFPPCVKHIRAGCGCGGPVYARSKGSDERIAPRSVVAKSCDECFETVEAFDYRLPRIDLGAYWDPFDRGAYLLNG